MWACVAPVTTLASPLSELGTMLMGNTPGENQISKMWEGRERC